MDGRWRYVISIDLASPWDFAIARGVWRQRLARRLAAALAELSKLVGQ